MSLAVNSIHAADMTQDDIKPENFLVQRTDDGVRYCTMGAAPADLLEVAHVAVISGGDWPQFKKQIVNQLPERANMSKLWLMPTTGTKLYTFKTGNWQPVYAELFGLDEKKMILQAFDASLEAIGFKPEKTWVNRIEDRGSQITSPSPRSARKPRLLKRSFGIPTSPLSVG